MRARGLGSFSEQVRETTWPVLALAIVACIGASLLVNIVAGPPGSDVRVALGVVERATGGWVQMPLVFAPIVLALVGAVMFGVGRLRCSDVGWRASLVGPALLVTLTFWVAMQPGLFLRAVLAGEQIRWNEAWDRLGVGWFCGQLLAQLLGNALVEETLFRGFFLVQLYLKASARFRPAVALILALLGSQVFFALLHIPNRLFVHVTPVEELLADQLGLLVQGLTYSACYLVTRNVFIGVGLHSIYDQPARLLPLPFSPDVQIVWYALVLVLLLAWPLARRRQQNRNDSRRPPDRGPVR